LDPPKYLITSLLAGSFGCFQQQGRQGSHQIEVGQMVAANLYFKPILGFAKGACHDDSIIDKGIQMTVLPSVKTLTNSLKSISIPLSCQSGMTSDGFTSC
jgi:hypothetical protein